MATMGASVSAAERRGSPASMPRPPGWGGGRERYLHGEVGDCAGAEIWDGWVEAGGKIHSVGVPFLIRAVVAEGFGIGAVLLLSDAVYRRSRVLRDLRR